MTIKKPQQTRFCSECATQLDTAHNSNRITCSGKCKARRFRRLRRVKNPVKQRIKKEIITPQEKLTNDELDKELIYLCSDNKDMHGGATNE